MPPFHFLKVNMVEGLQTLYMLLLFIITYYLYINESNKIIFSNSLSWEPLYVFVYDMQNKTKAKQKENIPILKRSKIS